MTVTLVRSIAQNICGYSIDKHIKYRDKIYPSVAWYYLVPYARFLFLLPQSGLFSFLLIQSWHITYMIWKLFYRLSKQSLAYKIFCQYRILWISGAAWYYTGNMIAAFLVSRATARDIPVARMTSKFIMYNIISSLLFLTFGILLAFWLFNEFFKSYSYVLSPHLTLELNDICGRPSLNELGSRPRWWSEIAKPLHKGYL